MYRNKHMRERLRRLDETASRAPKRTAVEAYAQYDRQNGIAPPESESPENKQETAE